MKIRSLLLTASAAIILAAGCKKEKVPPTPPTVTTATLTNVTTSSATAGGTITSDGRSVITASGIVWSRSKTTPTLADSVLNSTTGSGSFTANLTNLDFGTTYYIRAFATNALGTGYGAVVTLNTTNDNTKVRFNYMGKQVVYGVIVSTVTGKSWLDRNLGSSAVATSLTDTAGYGDLFQWGRGADGHQLRTSGKTSTPSSTDSPGNSDFIYGNSAPSNYGDWRIPQNDNLWQGSAGVNNPCPTGWHVPTKDEWIAETNTMDATSAFTALKLTLQGYRSEISGNVNAGSQGTSGYYWSSTVEPSLDSYCKIIAPGAFNISVADRTIGMAVRCIKD